MFKTRSVVLYIFLFVLTALVLDLGNPLFDKPSRDGGFFLYAGHQILDGKIPYRDFWDNKGPSIFYINAMGLWLGGGSRWGVWMVEYLCIFGTFLILVHALSKRWGQGAALFGVTMAGLGLRVALGYGNYTEEYALLFNAMGLSLFFSMVETEKNYWKYFWIGALSGLSFTFRANNIGGILGIMIAVILLYGSTHNAVDALKIVLATLVGFAVPFVLWMLYFALLGDVTEMVYGWITFNFSYSAAKDREWIDLLGGFGRYGISWYGWFTLLTWSLLYLRALIALARRKLKLSFFEIFLLFWFLVEIQLSSLSGRNFTHYYISWTLAVAVYSAFAFAKLWQMVFKVPSRQSWSDEKLGVLVSTTLVVMMFVISPFMGMRYRYTVSQLFAHADAMEYVDPISAYIRENTHPGDFVLTWYPELGINFMAGRATPVKYLYYPLFIAGSLTREIESVYIAGLIANRPELILDCSRMVNAIPSLNPAVRRAQYSTSDIVKKMNIYPGMGEIFSFVNKNYHIETRMESCILFRLNKDK